MNLTTNITSRISCKAIELIVTLALIGGFPVLGWSLPVIDTPLIGPIPTIVAGDPNGTPPDSPADRVDANKKTSTYAGVGSLFIDAAPTGDGRGFLCTATAITDYHILTAAHCLDFDNDGTVDISPVDVTFFLNYGGNLTHAITASAVDIHPDFTGFNNPVPNDDLAVITLSSPLPTGVPTYPLLGRPFNNPRRVRMVGYGMTGDGVSGYISNSASLTVKRLGDNRAEAAADDDEGSGENELFFFDFDGPNLGTNFLGGGTLGNDRETTLGGGDSGGPSFARRNQQIAIFGVNTFTFGFLSAAPLFGSGGGGVVVAPYVDWIVSDLGVPATVIGSNPEPATVMLFGVGILGFAIYGWVSRKRHRPRRMV